LELTFTTRLSLELLLTSSSEVVFFFLFLLLFSPFSAAVAVSYTYTIYNFCIFTWSKNLPAIQKIR